MSALRKHDPELQLHLFQERQKRDRALDQLETYRGDVVSVARSIAVRIAREQGRVTSTEVLRELAARCPAEYEAFDRRFMGAVFREGQGWVRLGYEPTGSRCRPVAIWKLREAAAG